MCSSSLKEKKFEHILAINERMQVKEGRKTMQATVKQN
jgi:hypothetical protein